MERPPVPTSPEKRENLEQMQDELARIEEVYRLQIATRRDLSQEIKEYVLAYMREHPEQEWGQVDGEDVNVHSVERTKDGDLTIQIAAYGMVADGRCIPIPSELKK